MGREYYQYREVAGAPGGPLFLLFHGTGGTEEQFIPLAQQLLPNAHLVAPRGDVSEAGMSRYFRRRGEGLYDLEDLAFRTTRMGEFIADMKKETGAPATIGLGYSNGANILASVLFAEPELVDAAVLMHPLIPFEPSPAPGLRSKRILITAGRRDPICPPERSEALATYFQGQGADVAVAWHDGGHNVAQSELAAVNEFLAPYRTA
jgi:phospholipase/carboxylesterase